MREILFRGKAIGGGNEWAYGSYLPKSKTICTETVKKGTTLYLDLFVKPETVGQYTGLTDKNGKKIFEGDIVIMDLNATVVKGFVKYQGAAFYIATNSDFWEIDNYYSLEVIGNIHDNPELLEGNK